MGERLYAHNDQNIWTVLYAGSTATVPLKDGKVRLQQETKYPWEGDVQLTLNMDQPQRFTLHLRVPGWCHDLPEVTINGVKEREIIIDKSFIQLKREWKPGDVVRLHLPMTIERVYADPRVKENVGRVALMRGPIVFCLEGVDHPNGQVRELQLPKAAKLSASFQPGLLGGVTILRGSAKTTEGNSVSIQAVPYFAWDNRAPGEMIVWLREIP